VASGAPDAATIRVLFLYVDGTLTNGVIGFTRDGDSREFWVADSANKRYFKVTARLLQRSDHVDFYLQEGERVDPDGACAPPQP